MKNVFNIFLTIPLKNLPEEFNKFIPENLQLNTLVLIGSGGPQMWSYFTQSRLVEKNSLDAFSKTKVIEWGKLELDEDLTGQFLYPHEDNHFPLQKLSRHLGFSHQSPLGIDIGQKFGLWFAFRALVVTKKEMQSSGLQSLLSPCESCSDKPCLSEMKNISKARLLCPFQINMRYCDEQILFHEKSLKTTFFPPQS